MVKKSVIILFLIFIFNNLYSNSARNEIHKYGFSALGDDISGLHYNPATLFHLSKTLSEFAITTSKKFTFNSFYIGYYLTRFPLFSKYYWTSVNLGLGAEKIDENQNYLIAIGGTLQRFIKYGITYKYVITSDITGGEKKYNDYDIGLLFRIFEWCDMGISIKNIQDDISAPNVFIPGLYFDVTDYMKFTMGIVINKDFSEINDFSFTLDINLIKGLYILSSLQKNYFIPGIGYNFNYNLENIYLASHWDKSRKKFTTLTISYYHKFHNLFYSRKGKEEISDDEDDEIVRTKKDVIQDQKFYLKKAKFYYAEQRIQDTKKMLYKVISLDKKSKYGREARKMLIKIKKIEKKIRRSK